MNTENLGEYIAKSIFCGLSVGMFFHVVVWFMTRGVVWFGEIFDRGRV
jgi:hypothetical protein